MALPAATALTTLTTLSTNTTALSTWCVFTKLLPVEAVLAHAVQLGLVALARPCHSPSCPSREHNTPLRACPDPRYLDGLRLRCDTFKNDWSIRRGTVFGEHRSTLAILFLILGAYQERTPMAAVARLAGVCYDTVSSIYRDCRQRVYAYMEAHPIEFDEDEIVEVDECHVGMLQKLSDKPVWIVGMIGRNSGKVALEVALDHKLTTMERIMNKHLIRSTTITISDQHLSFSFLEKQRRHFWSKKRKVGSRLWMEVEDALVIDHYAPNAHARLTIHSNTIEGFWSHMHRELKGAQCSTMHLYLADIMFRRLGRLVQVGRHRLTERHA